MQKSIKLSMLVFIICWVNVGLYAQPNFATIIKKSGTVNVRRSADNSFTTPAEASMGLFKGDALRTDENSYAALIFNSDKSLLKIREDSEIEIQEKFAMRTVKVSQGKILTKVTPGVSTSYRVETPTSVASVKGTEFWIISSPQHGDRFYGISGQVDIINLITGNEVLLEEGNMVISTPGGELVTIPVDPEELPEDPEETPESEAPTPEEQPAEETESAATEPGETEEPPATPPSSTADVASMSQQELETEEEAQPSVEGEAERPWDLGVGLGSVTIDGQIYNQISLRPEIQFGKLGVGLDLMLYMDEKGNIRKEEWDQFSDYLDKLYYLRWGQPGDPFFTRIGALENVTLGYGILMDGYSNTTEYPQVRKVGVHLGMQFDNLGWEAFVANFKEIMGPGLVAGRVTYQPLKKLPLQFGGSLVADINQYKGLTDTDGDYVPDVFDAFPRTEFELPQQYPAGDFGYNPEQTLKGDKYALDSDKDGIPDEIDRDIDGDGYPDNFDDPNRNFDTNVEKDPDPFNTEDQRKMLAAVAFDVGYPVLNMNFLNLHVYGQAGTFIPTKIEEYKTHDKFTPGWGIAAPGLRANIIKIINASVEYRYSGGNFLYNFWDRAYDFERVSTRRRYDQAGNQTGDLWVYTKDQMKLQNDPMQGVFGSLNVNVLDYVVLGSYYQHMTTGEDEVRSFMATASIPQGKIPKLAEAVGFYQRNNDVNPFRFTEPSENTILGYKVGFELGGGAILYYKFQKTYRDLDGDGEIDPKDESITLNTIETGFSF